MALTWRGSMTGANTVWFVLSSDACLQMPFYTTSRLLDASVVANDRTLWDMVYLPTFDNHR